MTTEENAKFLKTFIEKIDYTVINGATLRIMTSGLLALKAARNLTKVTVRSNCLVSRNWQYSTIFINMFDAITCDCTKEDEQKYLKNLDISVRLCYYANAQNIKLMFEDHCVDVRRIGYELAMYPEEMKKDRATSIRRGYYKYHHMGYHLDMKHDTHYEVKRQYYKHNAYQDIDWIIDPHSQIFCNGFNNALDGNRLSDDQVAALKASLTKRHIKRFFERIINLNYYSQRFTSNNVGKQQLLSIMYDLAPTLFVRTVFSLKDAEARKAWQSIVHEKERRNVCKK